MIVPSSSVRDSGTANLLAWAWRWKFTIAAPVTAAMLLAFTAYLHAPNRYSSEAVLVLDQRRQQVVPGESLVSPLPQENPVVKTELDVIGSRSLAERAAELLEREGMPIPESPTGESGASHLLQSIAGAAGAAIAYMGNSANAEPEARQDPPRSDEDDRLAKTDSLLSGLRVSNDGRSYTIFIAYTSEDATYSAAAANAFAQAYLDYQVGVHDAATRRASAWLGPRVDGLRLQLEEAERRLQNYRRDVGLIEADGLTMESQRVAALNAELVSVRAATAEARARLESARSSSADAGGDAALPLDSPVMQSLMAEWTRLDRARANFEERGALMSRELADISSELESIDAQIREESQRVLMRLAQEIEVAKRKEELLRVELDEARAELNEAENSAVRAAQLKREVEATSAIYASYLTRYKEAVEQEGVAVPEAQIISRAEAGVADRSGSLAKYLMAAILLGGAVGGGSATLRSRRAARLASPDSVESETGAAIVGYLPRMLQREMRRGPRQPLTADSPWACAFARLQVNSRLVLGHRVPCVVAVTSVDPGDGKTTVAIGLAQAWAAAGARVLLIDGDLHQPAVGARLRRPATVGFQEAIEGSLRLENAVSSAPEAGFDILPARQTNVPPEVVIGMGRLEALVAAARRSYDVTVLDCSAMAQLSDATQLAAAADFAFLVVRWQSSRIESVRWALEQLTAVAPGCRVGVVFNRLSHGTGQLGAAAAHPKASAA